MRFVTTRWTALLASGAVTVLSGGAAHGDDTEIFMGNPGGGVAPNIMLILDTSGSMSSNVITTVKYDPAQTYSGSDSCNGLGDRIYYSTNGNMPACSSDNWFPRSQLKCAAARASNALGSGGSGIYIDSFVRWGGNNNRSWQAKLNPQDPTDVECKTDNGADGDLSSTDAYPTNGSVKSTNGVWLGNANNSYWQNSTGIAATLYSANYVVYWNQHRSATVGTRIAIMRDAATTLLQSLSGVNIGLMRYSRDANGGMVAYPVAPIAANRTQLINAVNSYDASGNTPLSETLYESYLYFSGGRVDYGDNSTPFESVRSSRVGYTESNGALQGGNYDSPADYSCQKNYIIYLTDGLPTSDNGADSKIEALPNFSTLGGACDAGTAPGRCLVAMARYMAHDDTDLNSAVDGEQKVSSYWIGFGEDVASGAPFEYLERAAAAGKGRAYAASDATDLTSVLTSITLDMLQTSTSFAAPSVAVNAFNRTRSLSDLYVSVFRPSPDRHWPGNLKKYRVKAGEDGTAVVVGQNPNLPVIDEQTGFFVDEARSLWLAETDGADGPEVRAGGAAAKLPPLAERKVYTYLGANPGAPVTLSGSVSHEVSTSNTALDHAVLNLNSAPDSGDPSIENLIAWARGQDVLDEFPWDPRPNGDRTERRFAMGDPIHTQPALVIYGGTVASPSLDDAVAFVPTNDGYLHAVDASTGVELWSFIPKDFLPNLKELYLNNATGAKSYTLDGEIRMLKYDVNGNGIVEPEGGDRVFLYFGEGRGGRAYYALDVTSKNAPKFMWRIDDTVLTNLGQAWSTPTIARVNISGATQNAQKLVLVIGGGYDTIEDSTDFVANDTVGNRIFMVDAVRGTLLWSAGQTGANFNHTRMTHSIPSHVSVLDTNSDGYADRMYVGDMAAQLWRFDITNGQPAGNLVSGGVIASLGAKEGATIANTRRFYNQPDVAAIQRQSGPPFLNIAIGSGYRGHPLNTTVQDRLYSIRDYRPFQPMTQAEYDALAPTVDANLVDITNDVAPAISTSAPGWKLLLNQPNGSWRGEKSLGQATTINNNVVFTSYTPHTGVVTDPCAPTLGTNRAYRVRVLDGAPVQIDGEADATDRYEDFRFGGIATDISTMIIGDPEACIGDDCPDPDAEPCEGDDCPPPNRTQFVCLAGVRVLDICRDFNSRVKTYWREQTAN